MECIQLIDEILLLQKLYNLSDNSEKNKTGEVFDSLFNSSLKLVNRNLFSGLNEYIVKLFDGIVQLEIIDKIFADIACFITEIIDRYDECIYKKIIIHILDSFIKKYIKRLVVNKTVHIDSNIKDAMNQSVNHILSIYNETFLPDPICYNMKKLVTNKINVLNDLNSILCDDNDSIGLYVHGLCKTTNFSWNLFNILISMRIDKDTINMRDHKIVWDNVKRDKTLVFVFNDIYL